MTCPVVAEEDENDDDGCHDLEDKDSENEGDVQEPEKKKVRLNYGSKTTPHQGHGSMLLAHLRGDNMWCCACQKPVCHKRKCTADRHITRPSHYEMLMFNGDVEGRFNAVSWKPLMVPNVASFVWDQHVLHCSVGAAHFCVLLHFRAFLRRAF